MTMSPGSRPETKTLRRENDQSHEQEHDASEDEELRHVSGVIWACAW